MLNTIQHTQYHELCELLGGYHNEYWRELVFGNGEPEVGAVDGVTLEGRKLGYSMVRRTHYDGDYYNYVLAQVWDYSVEDVEGRGWFFVLFYNTGANDWVPEQVYSWGTRCPTEGEAGSIVDEIEFLRLRSER